MNNQDTRFANQYAIQWFPGHMAKTLRMMEQEIQHVDASLVLLDARIPLSSLNPEIERITARKPKLYALNKADLADPRRDGRVDPLLPRGGCGLCRHQRQAERRRERRQGRDRKGTVRPAGTPPEPRHGRCQDAGHALRHPQCGQIHLHQYLRGLCPRQGG